MVSFRSSFEPGPSKWEAYIHPMLELLNLHQFSRPLPGSRRRSEWKSRKRELFIVVAPLKWPPIYNERGMGPRIVASASTWRKAQSSPRWASSGGGGGSRADTGQRWRHPAAKGAKRGGRRGKRKKTGRRTRFNAAPRRASWNFRREPGSTHTLPFSSSEELFPRCSLLLCLSRSSSTFRIPVPCISEYNSIF
jgi:hypothetical protein